MLRTLEYDTENRLIGIVDRHNNRTTIERDGNGTPLRIIAPFGQVTTVTLDQDGMLSSRHGSREQDDAAQVSGWRFVGHVDDARVEHVDVHL